MCDHFSMDIILIIAITLAVIIGIIAYNSRKNVSSRKGDGTVLSSDSSRDKSHDGDGNDGSADGGGGDS